MTIAGARLRLRVAGHGPALLFIHGWALDLDVWAPQVDALSGSYRVVRFDRRGFGLSTGTPSVARDPSDVLALLARLGLERVTLIGASQGARAALRVALDAPERVRALVLDGPPALIEIPGATSEIPIARYRELARRGDIASVRRAWARHPLTQLITADPATRRRLSTICARYPGRDLLAPRPAAPPKAADDLRSLRAPMLVINGERDLTTRLAAGRALASGIAGARHVIIPRAAHLPNLDNPAAYNDALREFLENTAT